MPQISSFFLILFAEIHLERNNYTVDSFMPILSDVNDAGKFSPEKAKE
jgi:hypothetical protein